MNSKEEWAPVTGEAEGYEVSTCGQVRGKNGLLKLNQTFRVSGEPNFTWVTVRKENGKPWTTKVEVLMAMAFDINGFGDFVVHKDGNRSNNCIGNLELGSKEPFRKTSKPKSKKLHLEKRLCSSCEKLKALPEFYPKKDGKFGVTSKCRLCIKEKQVEYAAEHKQEAIDRKKKWVEENRAFHKKSRREYMKRTAPERRAWTDAYNKKKRQEGRTEKSKAYGASRRALRRNQWVEDIDRDVLFDASGGVCCLCVQPVAYAKWHLEHLTPLCRGGMHEYSNVGVAHALCNQLKHTRTFAEWIECEWFLEVASGERVPV